MNMFFAITIQWPTPNGLAVANYYGTADANTENNLFIEARNHAISRSGAPHDANVTSYYAAPNKIEGPR